MPKRIKFKTAENSKRIHYGNEILKHDEAFYVWIQQNQQDILLSKKTKMPKSGMRSNMITKISISICIPYDITSM